jgi:putative ABC transport system permease protein
MLFVAKMVYRELKSSWKRLAFFFICVAVGVAAIVALRSLIQNVRLALGEEARTLMAGDVSLSTDQPWSDGVRDVIDARLANIDSLQRTETVDITTMVRLPDETSARTKVVELRGLRPEFPFYGEFALAGGETYTFDLLTGGGALVGPELLTQMGLEVGDEILIGSGKFTIRGVILAEPGRQLGAFSFGPRVVVEHGAVETAGLLTVGSRARRQILLRVESADEVEPLVEQFRDDLQDEFVRVASYRGRENRIERNLERTENYLSLIGFVIVILGGIGVWSVTRVFVQQRLRSVAILKCLGATNGRILAIYMTQVGLLGLGGSLLGVGLAQAAMGAVPESFSEQAASAAGLSGISMDLTGSAVLQGLLVGLLISLLFAVVPLLDVRHAKPLLLLRHGRAEASLAIDWVRLITIGSVGGALVVVAIWQADSFKVGLWVVGGFAVVTIVLHLIGRGLVRLVAPLQLSGWFPLRHAVLNLSRPGNQTRVILLSVGLGSFFIIGVHAMQANLLSTFDLELRDDTPDMFLIDIQEDQVDGVRTILKDSVGESPALIPVLRARITGLEGEQHSFENARGARQARLGREYTVTYRAKLEENERIIAGRFWDETPALEPEVSIESDLYEEQGIQLGDSLRFDVLGREITARVTSIREVQWDDSRSGGFMFLFRPGSFGEAPHSYIALMHGPNGVDERARLQRDVAARYPNVSIIDGLPVIDTLRRVLEYVTLAISVVGGIALFSGGLILVGSVAMTKFQRAYEAAIFKTLGANTRVLATMLVLEYGVLGALAGTVGSLGALILTWALAVQVFDITWMPSGFVNVMGIGLTAVVVAIVGLISSLGVLQRRPMFALRAE